MDVKDSKVFTDEREAGGIEARELLPCPFCGKSVAHVGSVAEIIGIIDEDISTYEDDAWFYAVACDATKGGCGCTCGMNHETKAEAVAAWNRRKYNG